MLSPELLALRPAPRQRLALGGLGGGRQAVDGIVDHDSHVQRVHRLETDGLLCSLIWLPVARAFRSLGRGQWDRLAPPMSPSTLACPVMTSPPSTRRPTRFLQVVSRSTHPATHVLDHPPTKPCCSSLT